MPARGFCLNTYYCCLQIIDWTIITKKYIIISQKNGFVQKQHLFLKRYHVIYTQIEVI